MPDRTEIEEVVSLSEVVVHQVLQTRKGDGGLFY
jgi:hypothetical protein